MNLGKFAMLDAAYQNRSVVGTAGAVAGLAPAPTSPASLQITIGVGSVWEIDPTDQTAYGDLGVDNNNIVKQGLLNDPVTLTITPPSTPGFSQVFLVEVNLEDIDSGLAVVPYLNASNPSQPFSGPNNSGTSQYSVRQCQCVVALKAGPPAPTGSEITPTADPGWIGLYTIDVPNGFTQINAVNIKTLPTAPFFPTLPAVPPDVQYNVWTYATDTGSVNALAATVLPPPAQLQAGLGVFVKVANGNTGPTTFNLNGLGAVAVHRANGAALASGDISTGQVVALFYDGAAWQVLNFFGFTATTTNNITNTLSIPYVNDSGSVNAMVGVYSPAITSLSAGNVVTIKAANTNTGACTLQCNSLAAVPIIQNGVALGPRAILANEICVLFYDGTSFQLINQRWPYLSWDASSPPASDQVMMVGDQINISFTNVTTLPLKVATSPGVYEIEIALSANNSVNSDCILQPNNNTYSGAFDYFEHLSSDTGQYASPFVAIGPISLAQLGGGQSNYSGQGPSTVNAFYFDMFLNTMSADTINDVGPATLKITCTTLTAAKMVRSQGGIRGGPMTGFGIWNDAATAWSSLGTFCVSQPGNFATPYATISGNAVIKRLA